MWRTEGRDDGFALLSKKANLVRSASKDKDVSEESLRDRGMRTRQSSFL